MTHWRTLMDNEYLGSWDFMDEKGRPTPKYAQIAKVEQVRVKNTKTNKDERRPLITFKGYERPYLTNKTAAKQIEAFYGPQIEDWLGKWITLTAREVDAFGERKWAIRVVNKLPEMKKGKTNETASSTPPAGDEPAREPGAEG